MYFDETGESPADAARSAGMDLALAANDEMRVLLSINGLALLVIGILPQPLLALCYLAIKSL
jgi:NADH-quinone oxidoreductase subunit N